MQIKKLNDSKVPLVKIDKKWNKFQGRILFKEKLDQANSLLEKVKLPEVQ